MLFMWDGGLLGVVLTLRIFNEFRDFCFSIGLILIDDGFLLATTRRFRGGFGTRRGD